MKSRQLIWLLLIYCILNLPQVISATNLTDTNPKKVFILLRTEQNAGVLDNFKTLVQSTFKHNNVEAKILAYRVSEPLPQMRIFKTAYQEGFDFLLLIDQIANYNVGFSNRKVNVGGKFKIQSYDLKSPEPNWTNHGDKNCNITISESVSQFSKEIIDTIASEKSSKLIMNAKENLLAEERIGNFANPKIEEIDIPEYKLYEIKLLETQIKYQKLKTKRIKSQIELLLLKTELEIENEIERTKKIAIEIEKMKR